MTQSTRSLLPIKILLTITSMEFFGPMVRDFSPSHALNPEWVGHARVHLVWLLGFMFLSGLANLYLIWLRRPFDVRNLWLSAAWQSCNLGGFWIAYLLSPVYDGLMTVPGVHVEIFGFDENVFAFTILSGIMIVAILMLRAATARGGSHATP